MMDMDEFTQASMENAVEIVLRDLGVDLEDENFQETPKRVVKAYREILRFQNQKTLDAFISETLKKSFPTNYKGIVAQKGIKTISMCPHHMQPIQYEIDLGYVAHKKAIGLSKLTRIVEAMSARMVLQESLTQDIAKVFNDGKLGADGVIVIVRGKHGCMTNRGVKQDLVTTTSTVLGIFESDVALRQEFLALNNN
jgi:GTP cyclohydrolase I